MIKICSAEDVPKGTAISANVDGTQLALVHGEDDNFVPCEMSRKNYELCAAPKKLVTIPGAGHGLCYMVDHERYLKELKEQK